MLELRKTVALNKFVAGFKMAYNLSQGSKYPAVLLREPVGRPAPKGSLLPEQPP